MGPSSLADLASRRRRQELLDQPGLHPNEHARALRGLGRINQLSRSDAILWPAIADLARSSRGKSIRVLDLASGGGDVPLALARRAARARLDIQIEGTDISPEAVRIGQARARDRRAVRFSTLDALNEPIPDGYDVVMCSLFLHHLDEHEAIALLSKMAKVARRLVLVNDLIRGRAGYLLARVGCHVLSRSPIVRHDGPVSVAGAYTISEVAALAERAGLVDARLTRQWPCRFLLRWSRGNP